MTLSSLPVTALEHSKRWDFVEQAVAPPSHFTKSFLRSLSMYSLRVYMSCLVEAFALLGRYDAQVGSWLPTFRDNLSAATCLVWFSQETATIFLNTHRQHFQAGVSQVPWTQGTNFQLSFRQTARLNF